MGHEHVCLPALLAGSMATIERAKLPTKSAAMSRTVKCLIVAEKYIMLLI